MKPCRRVAGSSAVVAEMSEKLEPWNIPVGMTEEQARAEIAYRQDCAEDRAAALRAGIMPPVDKIADAPRIYNWSTYPNPGGGLNIGLQGVVIGHPKSRGFPTPIWTSPLHFIDEKLGLAVTEGHYYVLGARLDAVDEPVAKLDDDDSYTGLAP